MIRPLAIAIAQYTDTRLPGTVDSATAGLKLIDSKGIGQTDLLVWSSRGIHLFLKGQQPVTETGLEGLSGVLTHATAATLSRNFPAGAT